MGTTRGSPEYATRNGTPFFEPINKPPECKGFRSPRCLHLFVGFAAALISDFRVACDRGQAAVAQGFGGRSSVARGFLQQGVPQLMGVKSRYAQAVSQLAAEVLGTGNREPLGSGVFAGWLEADEQGGGVVGAAVQVVVDGGAGFVGDLHEAFAVAFADHPQLLGFQSLRFRRRISEIRAPVDSSRIRARSRLCATVSCGRASSS